MADPKTPTLQEDITELRDLIRFAGSQRVHVPALARIERALADLPHLEEAARLLRANRRALYDDRLWDTEFDAFDRWDEAERARQARKGEAQMVHGDD